MLKKILALFSFIFLFLPSFAFAEPQFILLPNVKIQRLMSVDAKAALKLQSEIIALVQKALKINKSSPYKMVRIRTIFAGNQHLNAAIVYLLGGQTKSAELVRIDFNNDLSVASIINHYTLKAEDFNQSLVYQTLRKPACPDSGVQFVIGNVFYYSDSVEKEVQAVYAMAKEHGYQPYLMDVNNQEGPQPTVQAYLDWLSCPNVKGFYNESHGYNQGILLADEDFNYQHIATNLVNAFKDKVTLFDSCETFRDPLLRTVTQPDLGNAKQYVAGYISLPFGASERVASCFWARAFNGVSLTQDLIEDCSRIHHLEAFAYQIKGNGDAHLSAAVSS